MSAGDLERVMRACHAEVRKKLDAQQKVQRMQEDVIVQQARIQKRLAQVQWQQETVRVLQKRAAANPGLPHPRLDEAWAKLRQLTEILTAEREVLAQSEEELKRASKQLGSWNIPTAEEDSPPEHS